MSEPNTQLERPPSADDLVAFFPRRDDDGTDVLAPVREVTLLEDRAQVLRRGKVKLSKGVHRLFVDDVAPVLQDLSLRAELSCSTDMARVTDVHALRAMRVTRAQQPEDIQHLRKLLDEQHQAFCDAQEDRRQAEERLEQLTVILEQGLAEMPQDASWGHLNLEAWNQTLTALFERSASLDDAVLDAFFQEEELRESLDVLLQKLRVALRIEHLFTARLVVDVTCDEDCEVDLDVHYVVPNAMWRPMHRIQLKQGAGDDDKSRLRVHCDAAIWQRTGEDWAGAQLSFSTARASLGVRPPLLDDDLLQAQRKQDEVVAEVRTAPKQRGGQGRASSAVQLDGVDDGGVSQHLKCNAPMTVKADGGMARAPLFSFESDADVELWAAPEQTQAVFKRCFADHTGPSPLLPGPVELFGDHGPVGRCEITYVAPGERFELGFGPDAGLRVVRDVTQLRPTRDDELDAHKNIRTQVKLFLSNLDDEEKSIVVSERIPVSEMEQVQVDLIDDKTKPTPKVDDDGICTWRIVVPPFGQARLLLGHRIRAHPDVRGL